MYKISYYSSSKKNLFSSGYFGSSPYLISRKILCPFESLKCSRNVLLRRSRTCGSAVTSYGPHRWWTAWSGVSISPDTYDWLPGLETRCYTWLHPISRTWCCRCLPTSKLSFRHFHPLFAIWVAIFCVNTRKLVNVFLNGMLRNMVSILCND